MPTIEQNLQLWNKQYAWPQAGEEWSAKWGGAEAQWYGTILPRIHSFVPVRTILEIAPGYGRWTQMLKTLCEKLIVVDLSESCIEACRQRFHKDTHIIYHVNDGKSLVMIPDETIDFVFSFDSLVHAENKVIEAYIQQLAHKLTPNGVGFIHHSNLGIYMNQSISKLLKLLIRNKALRCETMTAWHFKEYCLAAGLQCIGQEFVNWQNDVLLNDCFSLFTRRDSGWARPNWVLINKKFTDEISYVCRMMQIYTASRYVRTGG